MILDVLVEVGFCVALCKACQRLIYMQQNEKNYFAYTKPAFLSILRSPQLLGFHTFLAVLCSQQRFKFFQEPFRIWILQGWSTAPQEHILSQGWVQSGMPTLSALQKHVSWQEIFQRLPGPVQRLGTGNVGDAWKTTWDLKWNCSLDEPHFTPGKFTWTWIHAPTDSHSVASASRKSSHEREYMPPTPTA